MKTKPKAKNRSIYKNPKNERVEATPNDIARVLLAEKTPASPKSLSTKQRHMNACALFQNAIMNNSCKALTEATLLRNDRHVESLRDSEHD